MSPDRRPAVWVITPSLHREGGTERAVSEQVERWRNRFDLAVYTMEVRDVDLSGVRLRRLWRPPGPHLLRYLWWLLANRVVRGFDAVRFGAPDVVHSPGINALDAGAIGVHIVFAKHWASVREQVTGALRGRSLLRRWHRRTYWALLRFLERRVYGGPATLWALSSADASALERTFNRPRGSVPVVPYGVDAVRFSPDERAARRAHSRARLGVADRRVLLLVGNDWRKKGLDRAIAAMALLPGDYLLAVAGRDEPAPFRRLAGDLGVTQRLVFWPPTADILTYYAAADCLIAPSREDAFHLPALEAAACGLPIVLSAEAGAGELAGIAETAVIVRDADCGADLAGAVTAWFAEDDVSAAERVRAGRSFAERQTWDAYAARTAELVLGEIETPRVLVLATDPWGKGGIERVTRSLLRALSARFGPQRLGLFSVWGQDAEQALPLCRLLHSGTSRPGAGTTRVGIMAKSRFALAVVLAARRWRHRRLLAIACHAHVAPVAWVCRLLWGTPFAVWGHGTEVWGGMRWTVVAALRRARALFVPTRFTGEALAGQVRGLARLPEVVPNGLSDELTHGVDAARAGDQPVVLSVARLNREDAYKGVDTLLLAWPQVLARAPDARLVVIGDGDDRSRLERMARHVGVERTVRFAGRLPDRDLAAAYAKARVFALPGRVRLGPRPEGEGFGMVFLEAAAAGLPCVAGRAGGAVEAVEDGRTGLLVDPEAPSAVADAVVRLLVDPELARRLGQAGRARAISDFGFARFADRVGRLAESVVA